MKTRILNITTEVPAYHCTQAEIFESFSKTFQNNEKFKNIFLNSGISSRHTVLENPANYFYAQKRSTRDRNEIYQKHAYELCVKAIERCLGETGTAPQEIDDLIVVSCTGVNIPGLDILLAKKFAMRPDLQRTAILFMGCYAAFPALRKSLEYTKFRPGSKCLIVCIELCSLHFQYNETIENVVSSSIFADGCAVALVEADGNDVPAGMPVIVDSLVHTQYDTTEHMAFILTDEGFQMNLSAYVPDILKVNANGFISALLEKNGVKKEDIDYWLIHPGGIKIVNYLQQSLSLTEEQVKYSKQVLNDYGNMSSATIFFVLNELLKEKKAKPGDTAVMMAFGPGLTMEALLLRWE
jgi:alpha-pyrone synthase